MGIGFKYIVDKHNCFNQPRIIRINSNFITFISVNT